MMKDVCGYLSVWFAAAAVTLWGCDSTTTSPQIGGETNLDITRVGAVYNARLSSQNNDPALSRLNDSIVVIKSDDGEVTFKTALGFDSLFVVALDSALGTTALPYSAKLALVDHYLRRYGATLDTTDKENMRVDFELKLRVTSEGIQDYVYSKGDRSRPFTVVRYAANVGETWSFTDEEGKTINRTVVYKSTEDDYPMGFWQIKVIKVEQTQQSDLAEKITYIANHKFGLVGVELLTVNGKTVRLGITPP